MIDLLARNPRSALGIRTILEMERIPYRTVASVAERSGALLVIVADELTTAEIAALEETPSLVLGGGTRFAEQAFGARAPRIVDGPCAIPLSEPIWPAAVVELAHAAGKPALRLPLAPIVDASELARGSILALFATGRPAIVERSRCVWSLIDLGAGFANLLNEDYRPTADPAVAVTGGAWPRRLAESVYYAAPESLRRWVQRRAYRRLEARLRATGECSEYPIDATGWLLVELVKSLVKLAAGSLVRLARWPAPYHSAAALTHDIEPRRYAYTRGLDRLLDTVATTGHPATFGLVAGASARYLRPETVQRLQDRRVLCHGLEHRGENVHGRRRVAADLRKARTRLEECLGRPVTGYRSPRLDRSPDLAWALDRTGFAYDSSYPDVDRENLAHFGAGVCVNLPYRPLVEDDGGQLRFSRCLELPLTSPDCIQPLFAGASVDALRATVEVKASFVRATGGLYVALVHGGVFGEQDEDVRTAHLQFVHRQLEGPDVWLASMEEIADWWTRREALRVSVKGSAVHVANAGRQMVVGARVILEHEAGTCVLPVPPLPGGTQVALAIPRNTAVSA
jgi:peptidoglycan/xylan/chitin deacetylase (PgdA/CDA1 family)